MTEVRDNENDEYGDCPECDDGTLVERQNYKTQESFLGCTNYPDCDYTEDFGGFDQ